MFNVGGQQIYEVEFKLKVVSCDEISDQLSAYKVVDTLHVTKPQNGFDRFYCPVRTCLRCLNFLRFGTNFTLLTGRGTSPPRHSAVCYHLRELALKLSCLSAVTTSN